MGEHEGQLGSNEAPGGADETLRRYLLCRLPADERLRIDERLLADDELSARIGLVESELTDDYAAGRLDTTEREAFAQRFLVVEERKRQLRFTSALQDYSRSQAASYVAVPTRRALPSWQERLAAIFSPQRPAWAVAGSFAVLILLVGLAWFVVKHRRETTPSIARNDSPVPAFSPPAASQDSAPAAVSPVSQPTPAQKPEAVVPPAEPPSTIVSLVLLPGAARGGGELARVTVPAGRRDVVRFTLVFEDEIAPGVYQAELLTAEGRSVSVAGNVKIEPGKRMVVPLSARLLHRGDYQIKLSHGNAAGQAETVARYYFRALKD